MALKTTALDAQERDPQELEAPPPHFIAAPNPAAPDLSRGSHHHPHCPEHLGPIPSSEKDGVSDGRKGRDPGRQVQRADCPLPLSCCPSLSSHPATPFLLSLSASGCQGKCWGPRFISAHSIRIWPPSSVWSEQVGGEQSRPGTL